MRLPLDTSSRWVRLGALVVAVAVLAGAVLQVRAQRAAHRAAAAAEARYAFQQDLTLAYDDIAEPTREAAVALSQLRETLQQHLALTGRTGDELATERADLVAAVREAVVALRQAAAGPAPTPPAELAPDAPASLRTQLAELRDRAGELATELEAVVDAALTWAERLAALRTAALDFVAVAESHAATTDPSELIEQWNAERAPLAAYRSAAEAAAQLPGLAPVAEVHVRYVDANVAWIDEAVALLEAGRLGTYNARLAEVFEVEDPFGFTASLQEAIEQAFELGVLADLVVARESTTALLDRIAEARRLTPILLRPSSADSEPADPTPTDTPVEGS